MAKAGRVITFFSHLIKDESMESDNYYFHNKSVEIAFFKNSLSLFCDENRPNFKERRYESAPLTRIYIAWHFTLIRNISACYYLDYRATYRYCRWHIVYRFAGHDKRMNVRFLMSCDPVFSHWNQAREASTISMHRPYYMRHWIYTIQLGS